MSNVITPEFITISINIVLYDILVHKYSQMYIHVYKTAFVELPL